jgi:choline-sulfatase
VDNAVGRIVDVLDYLGYGDDTIVIYSSDHGEMGGEHGTWQKTLFYEAAARVPFIIRWPGVIEKGIEIDTIAGLIDMFPTICDAAGIETPDSCEGISLIPLLKDGITPERNGVFSESAVLRSTEIAGCMYRTGNHKYCYYIDGSEELFDLESDPEELRNLAKNPDFDEIITGYRKIAKDFWRPEEYMERLAATPIMCKEKHFYEFSNQFVTGDGRVLDARP